MPTGNALLLKSLIISAVSFSLYIFGRQESRYGYGPNPSLQNGQGGARKTCTYYNCKNTKNIEKRRDIHSDLEIGQIASGSDRTKSTLSLWPIL